MKIIFSIIILAVAIGAVYFLKPPAQTPANTAAPSAQMDVMLMTPSPNQLVTSPLQITGRARGTWFFEASFPVQLYDANGAEIAVAVAQAQGEWMTEDFVPFVALFEFSAPTTSTGTLVLEKDNPSGLPENADEVRVPVKFR